MSTITSYSQLLDKFRSFGNKKALIDAKTDNSLTYQQLVDTSIQIAQEYELQGLKSGDKVILHDVDGIDWVPLFFGAQLINITVVPIDTRVSDELLGAMIQKTNPTAYISNQPKKFKSTVCLSPKAIIAGSKKHDLDKKYKNKKVKYPGQILMTSGTWSQPKGVTLSQSNTLSNMNASNEVYPLKKDEIFLSILPLSHAYEQMCGLHMPLSAGCTIVYLDEVLAEKIKAANKKYNVTIMVAVPRVLDLFKKGILKALPKAKQPKVVKLANKLRFFPMVLRRRVFSKVHESLGDELRTIVVGGAPLDPAIDMFFQGLGYRMLIGYGLSETSPIVSISLRQRGRVKGDVGGVLPNLAVKVNEKDELLIKGPSVFLGYWPENDLQGWFNTGDQAIIKNNRIILTGRTKNLLVFPSGDKLAIDDLEGHIDKIEGVEESMVLYHPDKSGSEVLNIIYKSEKNTDPDVLRKILVGILPYSVHIESITNIHPEQLHRTHTMKLSRKQNYEIYGLKLNN